MCLCTKHHITLSIKNDWGLQPQKPSAPLDLPLMCNKQWGHFKVNYFTMPYSQKHHRNCFFLDVHVQQVSLSSHTSKQSKTVLHTFVLMPVMKVLDAIYSYTMEDNNCFSTYCGQKAAIHTIQGCLNSHLAHFHVVKAITSTTMYNSTINHLA